MNERKNIDRFFQEKFKDFEVEPSEKVWKNIESKLKEKKKDRKIIPFWLQLSGIAAALLIGFFTTDSLLNSKKDNNKSIVVEEKNSGENSGLNAVENKETITSSEVSNAAIPKNNPQNSSDKSGIQSDLSNTKNENYTNRKVSNNAVTESKVLNKENNSPDVQIKSKTDLNETKDAFVVNNFKNSNKNTFKNKKEYNSSVASIKSKTDLNETKNAVVINNFKNSNKNTFKNKKANPSIVGNSKAEDKNPLVIPQSEATDSKLANQGTSDTKLEANKNQIVVLNTADVDKKTDSTTIAANVPNALEELLKEKEKKIVTSEPKLNKWQVTSSVAPIYFSSTSNGSPLDSEFENNSKEYKTNLGYGLGVQYALNPKFSLRTGVNAVALEYSTNNVVFYQTKNAVSIKHVNNNLPGSLIQIENKNTLQEITDNNTLLRKFDGDLNQKSGYIEVPLELSYKIINKKFGLEVIGGLSTLFLNENKVSLVSSGLEMNIGEANNLNAMHFSTNVGLGFKYNLLKSFQVNFEPMFKYQINTFSNDSGNFKPYFFGLYTGMSYRF